jgi:hypothetical protein
MGVIVEIGSDTGESFTAGKLDIAFTSLATGKVTTKFDQREELHQDWIKIPGTYSKTGPRALIRSQGY